LEEINQIYNVAVAESVATLDWFPRPMEEARRWMQQHDNRFRVLIAENESNQVVGWATLSRWSKKKGYENLAEVSIYIHNSWQKQGIGKALLRALVLHAKETNFKNLLSLITEGNHISEKMHHSFGFKQIGVLPKVGEKFGQQHDVGMWVLAL